MLIGLLGRYSFFLKSIVHSFFLFKLWTIGILLASEAKCFNCLLFVTDPFFICHSLNFIKPAMQLKSVNAQKNPAFTLANVIIVVVIHIGLTAIIKDKNRLIERLIVNLLSFKVLPKRNRLHFSFATLLFNRQGSVNFYHLIYSQSLRLTIRLTINKRLMNR